MRPPSARCRAVLLRDADTWAEPPVVRPPDRTAAGLSIRYRIDGEIARGGMGEVLKGRDPDIGRDVAIKVLRDDLSGRPEMVGRFVEEAQIGGQLQHPGIVPVYELGTFADRRPFFSMKLVRGQTFAQVLAARLSPADGLPRSLGIFEQVAQTVAYAHARGVIHRDLKPSNVMVGSFGEVQVMDWGLAKVLPLGGVADDERAGRVPEREEVIATAQRRRPGRGAVAGRLGAGYALLHGAGAGPGRDRRGGRAGRRLRPGFDPLRGPDRLARVHRPDLGRDPAQGRPRRFGRRPGPARRLRGRRRARGPGPRLPGRRAARPAARRRGRPRADHGVPGRRAGAAPRRRDRAGAQRPEPPRSGGGAGSSSAWPRRSWR